MSRPRLKKTLSRRPSRNRIRPHRVSWSEKTPLGRTGTCRDCGAVAGWWVAQGPRGGDVLRWRTRRGWTSERPPCTYSPRAAA